MMKIAGAESDLGMPLTFSTLFSAGSYEQCATVDCLILPDVESDVELISCRFFLFFHSLYHSAPGSEKIPEIKCAHGRAHLRTSYQELFNSRRRFDPTFD